MATDDERVEAEGHTLVGQREPLVSGSAVRSVVGFLTSMLTHLLLVVALALWVMPGVMTTTQEPLVVTADEPLEELETVFLDEQQHAATEMTFAAPSASPTVGAEQSQAEEAKQVELDQSLLKDPVAATVDIDGMLAAVTGRKDLINEVPQGTPGKGRSVVDGYQEAIDRITREIMFMLYKEKVLVIWCFDQSGSMKDDQREISDRIERVYAELGLSDRASGDALMTAVTSYGESLVVHTKAPTADYKEIRAAIDAVPVDSTGEEQMCLSVGRAIAMHRDYAIKGRRRMALILVTDESGDRQTNVTMLEATIAEAKSARCKIYILGREAVFGYPYAYFRYRHPQTGRPHWLRTDRGPETAFVEQLQVDGFRRRHDAHPSGFGPYEQARMARETGGTFFLLPSVEKTLVLGQNSLARGENRRYELEAMEWYHPDLRSRQEIYRDRDRHELRTMVWKVISDLNPYDAATSRVIEVADDFSLDPAVFVKQVRENQTKAKLVIDYLTKAAVELEKKKFLCDREPEIRWRANYQLLYAQLLSYQVRLYEYGAYLEQCLKDPPKAPPTKPPNLHLVHWDITTRKERLTGEKTEKYIDQANAEFATVIKEHPGTPWAARCQWELNRGYGVQLVPFYDTPYKEVSNPDPLPKL